MASLLCSAQAAQADVAFFPPPQLQYETLCIPPVLDDPNKGVSEQKLTIGDKMTRALLLMRGTPTMAVDVPTAYRLLEEAIKTGRPAQQAKAKSLIAELLLEGKKIKRDDVRAVTLLEESLSVIPVRSGFLLGNYYEKQSQYDKASFYYQQAAAAGNPQAYLLLSALYRSELVPSPSPTAAADMLAMGQNLILEKLGRGQCKALRHLSSMMLSSRFYIHDEGMAIKWLQAGVRANDTYSLEMLGDSYNSGYRMPYRPKEAMRLWQRAAANGSSYAMYRIGNQLLHNKQPAAYPEALEWLNKAVLRGSDEAVNVLVTYYQGHFGTAVNDTETARWLEKAITRPAPLAIHLFDLAELYAAGRGVAKNPSKAFTLYEQAASLGSNDAMVKLGDAYQTGQGVEAQPVLSYRYYRQAASKGNNDAMVALIHNYQCGVGKGSNLPLAEKWKKRAIYFGSSSVIRQEILRLFASSNPAEKQAAIPLLLRWIKNETAKLPQASATRPPERNQLMLMSVALRKGIGIPANPEAAQQWEERTLAKGFGQAGGMIALAKALLDPNLLGINAKRAAHLLQQAEALGEAKASVALGQLYERGAVGFPIDAARAEIAYRKAAEAGNVLAQSRLGVLLLGKTEAVAQTEALQWLKQAAEAGNLRAMLKVAGYYLAQKSHPEALHEGQVWLKKAQQLTPCTPSLRNKLAELANQKTNKRSVEQLRHDAEKGDTSAMRELAKALIFEEKEEEAVAWYQKAAEAGDSAAMQELGNAYLTGIGVAPSQAEAQQWWQKAAAGNPQAVATPKK
jgi:TPR repeat protein